MSRLIQFLKPYLLHIVWFQALVALLGSLFFSEVMHWAPCVLCWYQRICMYPLVILLATGIIKKDNRVIQYTLPLAILGFGFALFHSLLYYQILPDSYAPCVQGVSCTVKYIEWFGFITIPLMSLTAFGIIIGGLCWLLWAQTNTPDSTKK